MGKSRSGVQITSGPDAAQTAALRPRDRATFTFKFEGTSAAQSVEVTIVSIRHVTDGVYMIVYVASSETKKMSYNARDRIGVVIQ